MFALYTFYRPVIYICSVCKEASHVIGTEYLFYKLDILRTASLWKSGPAAYDMAVLIVQL